MYEESFLAIWQGTGETGTNKSQINTTSVKSMKEKYREYMTSRLKVVCMCG